ncbi:hypothetical protein [Pseudoalteromonas aurantia]|uniref:Uncharacterized protein n=1 Tax=Pseudoalteromonas aurantia TaxID=43654 RepID=A0ABY2VRU0_9GAMM|nr:hypothetical protein [Pseudoalteromonas aurantia]TMO68516.1 hypothetical protein CWC20_21245 [Pseudoalteromonas aurantia]
MEYVVYDFPHYAERVITLLLEEKWLIHSFPLSDESEIFNPSSYLYNAEFKGVEYTIHLDLNIYQYILNAFKKDKKNPLHRSAIALVVFAKFTNVKFDPSIAIYEKLNYKKQCPDELIDDLILFRQIDNAEMDHLAEFVLGSSDIFKLPKPAHLERLKLKMKLTEFRRLKKWDTLYALVLKLTELYYCDKGLSNEDKLEAFWRWCHEEFLFSLVATSMAIKLFGKRRIPKLMKYNPKHSVEKNKNHVVNMTWDLFLIDKFFENWVGKLDKQEFIYASNDKPFQEVLKAAIKIQNEGKGVELAEDLSTRLISSFVSTFDQVENQQGRRITSVTDFSSFREGVINNYEQVLKVVS